MMIQSNFRTVYYIKFKHMCLIFCYTQHLVSLIENSEQLRSMVSAQKEEVGMQLAAAIMI